MDPVDGNAIAGSLYAAFDREMTSVRGTCTTCGDSHPIAQLQVYLRAPGAVARCPVCGEVQIVLIEARGVVCVDVSGFTSLRT